MNVEKLDDRSNELTEPRFYTNASRLGVSIIRFSAEVIQALGYDLQISDSATDVHGRSQPDTVAIYAASEARKLLGKVLSTPEAQVLYAAFVDSACLGRMLDETIGECQWDEVTKERVRAGYHRSMALFWDNETAKIRQRGLTVSETDLSVVKSKKHWDEVNRLLGEEQFLEEEEIKRLVAQVVEREARALSTKV